MRAHARLYFPVTSEQFIGDVSDISSKRLYNMNITLLDDTFLGRSNNFIVQRDNGLIVGMEVSLNDKIKDEVGEEKVTVPLKNAILSLIDNQLSVKVNALYVLNESFYQEKKLI